MQWPAEAERRFEKAPVLRMPDHHCACGGHAAVHGPTFRNLDAQEAGGMVPGQGTGQASLLDLLSPRVEEVVYLKTSHRDHQKWTQSVRFTPRGLEKKSI